MHILATCSHLASTHPNILDGFGQKTWFKNRVVIKEFVLLPKTTPFYDTLSWKKIKRSYCRNFSKQNIIFNLKIIIDVSFTWICPCIDHEFCYNIVPPPTPLTMLWWISLSVTGQMNECMKVDIDLFFTITNCQLLSTLTHWLIIDSSHKL